MYASRKKSKNKASVLIIVIVLVAVASIVMLAIAGMLANSLAFAAMRMNRYYALQAAHSGLDMSIYDYMQDPATLPRYWNKVTSVNMGNNLYYSAGVDANFLLVDAHKPEIPGASGAYEMTVQNIRLYNISSAQSITVNKMKVEWYNFGGVITAIRLGGGAPRWQGSASSGTTITLTTPFTLAPKAFSDKKGDNKWTFDTAIPPNATIIATFFFDDGSYGSSRKVIFLNNGLSGNNEFSVTVTGEVRGNINYKRTLEATFDVGTEELTSYQESERHV